LELNFPQISELQKHIKTGIIAYGHLPLMLTRNCPVGNCQKCDHKLQDRTGRVFEVACYRKYFEILNCVPLYIADILPKSLDFVTLYFNSEKKEEILKAINSCEKHLPPLNNFTRGLYNK
jgi:putative protease